MKKGEYRNFLPTEPKRCSVEVFAPLFSIDMVTFL